MSGVLTAEQARGMIGRMFRIDPSKRKHDNGKMHFHGAKLVGVKGDVALIEPVGHNQTEEVPLNSLREWKARNAQLEERGILRPMAAGPAGALIETAGKSVRARPVPWTPPQSAYPEPENPEPGPGPAPVAAAPEPVASPPVLLPGRDDGKPAEEPPMVKVAREIEGLLSELRRAEEEEQTAKQMYEQAKTAAMEVEARARDARKRMMTLMSNLPG